MRIDNFLNLFIFFFGVVCVVLCRVDQECACVPSKGWESKGS